MPIVTHDEWLSRAKSLDLSGAHHIDGADEGGSGVAFGAVSPRDGQVLAQVADAGTAEVDAAVAAARRAFGTGPAPYRAPIRRRQPQAPEVTPSIRMPVTSRGKGPLSASDPFRGGSTVLCSPCDGGRADRR